jgi:Zn-dependent protease
MNGTFAVGRLAGIPIRLHWTWLAVFGLVTWALADAVFPDAEPGRSTGVYVVMAIAAAAALFLSLLLHELGHALQARRERMRIEDITLWLLGGVARFSGEFPSARAELRVALAGPAVTVVLTVLFGVLAPAPLPSAAHDVVVWLGVMNAALLVFNLLPALPLDGGRVLHAIVWQRTRDLRKATAVGSSAGRGLGFVLIAIGIGLAFAGVPTSGVWLAVLGWFLLRSATAEAQELLVRETLGQLAVGDLMVHRPVTAEAEQTLSDFLDGVAHEHRFTSYPVVEDGRAVGMIGFSRVVASPRGTWETTRVRDCMVPVSELPALRADMPLRAALGAMREAGVDRAPVLDGQRLAGFLSLTEVARVLSEAAARPASGSSG